MPWRHVDANPFEANGTTMGVRSTMVRPRQLLRDAALHAICTGCGEGWLLQPKLAEFETSEYR